MQVEVQAVDASQHCSLIYATVASLETDQEQDQLKVICLPVRVFVMILCCIVLCLAIC